MDIKKKNDKGEVLKTGIPELRDPSFGTGKTLSNGWPDVIWPEENDVIDRIAAAHS